MKHCGYNGRRGIAHVGGWSRSTIQVYPERGGRQIAAPTGVVPFNRTGCIRDVSMAMNHRRYIAWFRSTAQVVFETWRAADCRPYRHAGRWYHLSARVIFATFPERHIGRSLRFRWWVYFLNRRISKAETSVAQ